jgi:hypothetical protein
LRVDYLPGDGIELVQFVDKVPNTDDIILGDLLDLGCPFVVKFAISETVGHIKPQRLLVRAILKRKGLTLQVENIVVERGNQTKNIQSLEIESLLETDLRKERVTG